MTTNNRNSILASTLLLLALLLINNSTAEWLNHGGYITNRREATDSASINSLTVSSGRLRLKWKFPTGFDVTATPALATGIVYFPSWDGYLYALNAFTGSLIWKQNLGQLTGIPPTGQTVNVTVARATPVVAGDLLLVCIYGPAYVVALNRLTGQLVWKTLLDPGSSSVITASGTVSLGGFFVGVSSLEETLPTGQCCKFRGSMARLDVPTGKIRWQTYLLPDNGGRLDGYSGAAVWGSSPSIDLLRNHVYVATGNLYTAPPDVQACQARQNNQTMPPASPDQCVGSDAHFDSFVALDLRTGNIAWSRNLGGYDVFYFACLLPNNTDCPTGPNPDADFGEAPMMLTIKSQGRLVDVVVAVQKSGFAWALKRDNGDIVWFTKAGPGSEVGGGIWGAATDGIRIYTNIANGNNAAFVLKPSNRTTTAGGWVAMDANTGQILWTTANPSNDLAAGPVTIANGVLFAGSVAPNGPVYGMDARTGAVIWSYDTGATVYGGVSVSYGCVYMGHGYSVGLAKLFHPTWTRGKYLFAFCAT